MCQDYRTKDETPTYRDSQHFLSECITRSVLIVFNKSSLTKHYFEGVNLKMLSQDDFAEESFGPKYAKIISACHIACPGNDCSYVATYTGTED